MSAPVLTSTEELAALLGRPNLVVFDASWYLPSQGRDARAEYRAGHVPGALFFDIDALSDRSSPLPHMLPSEAEFAAAMSHLGVSESDRIVVYDGAGLFSAARAWWTLCSFGARSVTVLDGGLPVWRAEGRPLDSQEVSRPAAIFHAMLDRRAVAGTDDVVQALATGSPQIVDARSAERFRGEAPEPRPEVRSGHMPGARNVPFGALVRDGRLAEPDAIRSAFKAAGVDVESPVTTSCGSGVTAAVLSLALEHIGHPAVSLYDGSWTEWGTSPDLPVVTGPA